MASPRISASVPSRATPFFLLISCLLACLTMPDHVRRVRSKSELEPVSAPIDLHITKCHRTFTNFDSSDHNKTVEDKYGTYVESAKIPITTILKAPPPISTHSEITDGFVEQAINYASDRLKFRRVTPRTATVLPRYLELAKTVTVLSPRRITQHQGPALPLQQKPATQSIDMADARMPPGEVDAEWMGASIGACGFVYNEAPQDHYEL